MMGGDMRSAVTAKQHFLMRIKDAVDTMDFYQYEERSSVYPVKLV
jgi:hypothetical protein